MFVELNNNRADDDTSFSSKHGQTNSQRFTQVQRGSYTVAQPGLHQQTLQSFLLYSLCSACTSEIMKLRWET